MPRFRERREKFEVKREMSDGGKIRPDDDKKNIHNIDPDLLEELGKVGFHDEEIETLQEKIEIEIDENGNPIIPEGWTFLTHGSSIDRWDESLLGNDFVVGNGIVNGQEVKGRPLSCVERDDAKFSYSRRGSTTAKAYGGNQQSFEIRVLFYKNPRLGDGKVVRDKLNQDELKDVTKYYMYQGGRHPAVPSGTKLVFLQNGDFDEITNTNGNNIMWYIPEQYLEHYLEDVEKSKQISENDQLQEDIVAEQENNENDIATITNKDVEQELSEFFDDDITNDYLEAYLAEKISQIYGDRLGDAGIFNVKKFLDGKLNDFQGVESYKAIIEELESTLELSENLHKEDLQGLEQSETTIEQPIEEEIIEDVSQHDEVTNSILNSGNEKTIQEEQETGIRLSSVNGKPLEQMTALYKKAGVKQSDLQTAYLTISRTKNEREQSISHTQAQPNINDFEGR